MTKDINYELEYRTHLRACVRLGIVPMRKEGFVAAIRRAIHDTQPYAVVRHDKGHMHIHPCTGATSIERDTWK